MIDHRRLGLSACCPLIAGVFLFGVVAAAQETASPFESVPQTSESAPATQQPSPFETPTAAEEQRPAEFEDVIEAIEFRGARRIPQDMLRAQIFTKRGDRYSEDALHRDFIALWNTGRFDDITLSRERGVSGWIILFRVVERRVVRSIKYEGNKSIQVSEILERFQENRVGLTVESQYDPNRVQRAVTILKEFLAERGRQYATVEPEVRQIPPSSLELTFKIDEGPKVKVGKINIEGNQVQSDRQLIRSMRGLKPIGIPYSIFFEDLFARSYDETKLLMDRELIRNHYQEQGYFTARAIDHAIEMRDSGGGNFRIPLLYPNKPTKKADVTINVEEGQRYYLNRIRVEGATAFRSLDTLAPALFEMNEGDVFGIDKLRKGIENLGKLYGEYGYIDFVAEPDVEMIPNSNRINLSLIADEGDQYFVRRIDFSGNTTTRDKVIRRELLLDEGDMYNTRLWELSILRLNQLGYFEALKEEEAAEIRRDTRSKTVDITLQVKERGKNMVQMNGGVSGIAGTFLGFGYATNNFLGLGETLSIDAQLGDRLQTVQFGFTEPYVFDRPIQAGFTIQTSRFDFDQGREISLLAGRDLRPVYEALGASNLLNYVSQGYGFTTFLSYPLRGFARLSLTYGYDVQDIETLSDSASSYFEYVNFQGLDGPNSLSGIRTSRVVPAYLYNTVDHPITPSRGTSIYASTSFAGLGGNVKMIQPTVEFKRFRAGLKRGHVMGFRLLGRMVSGYGGVSAPPFNRFYMGGENDVRGFDIWGISPMAWIPTSSSIPVYNVDGSPRVQRVVVDGEVRQQAVLQDVPIYRFIFPGGDTSIVGNYEYRIPVVGPLTLALFFDAGVNRVVFPDQLKLNPGRLAELNSQFPQASFDERAVIAPGTTRLRTSTGVEFQVMMPVVNAPFRLYWAYNPTILQTILRTPVVLDRSFFPNQATFLQAVSTFGSLQPWYEERTRFRFTVSRTF